MSESYKKYVLVLLTAVFTLNFVDRILIILLLEPIKNDLHLSDTQLGFMAGIAFALFYATLGIPIARLADKGDRVSITSAAMALWGLTVMACVFVRNFTQLVCARVAAAVGEAGCMPPTYSLVGDYFPQPKERTRAVAVYWLANPLASLVGNVVGGALNKHFGWRMTFLIMGIPGLMVAFLLKLTVKEPRKSEIVVSTRPLPKFGEVLRRLWSTPSSRHLCLAIIALFFMALGLAPWYAAFLVRSHHMAIDEIGMWFGLSFGVFGAAGTFLGGHISSRVLGGNEEKQMRVSAGTIALLIPLFAAFLLLPEKKLALIAMLPLVIVFNFFFGPAFALLQRLVSDDMRATTLSVVMLLANLIGMGIGPQIVGIASDLLAPRFGENSLRYAMLGLSFVAIWPAYHFWAASRTIKYDLERNSQLKAA